MMFKKAMWTVIKITGVLAINAAVLMVLVADDEKIEPQEAHADISQFMDATVFASANTGDIISESGMTPRAYEVNGNTVYFAVGESKLSPRQVLGHYQTEFTAAGVNSKKWLENPQQKINGDEEKLAAHGEEAREYVRAMANGEVVPYLVSDKYVSMGGPILKADKFTDIFDEWGWDAFDDPNRVMKGWRFIDAERTDRGVTRVTSVWADEKFDFQKFQDPNRAGLGLNDAIPACPGCRLLMRSKSKNRADSMSMEQYSSQQDINTVASYYTGTMQARGWDLSDTQQVMDYAASRVPDHPMNTHGKMLSFAKGDHSVTYAILPAKTGSVVTVTESW